MSTKKEKGINKYNNSVTMNAGKVGTVRYYTKGGVTYTRSTTVSKKSTTRSLAQYAVKCRMANISHCWQALKDFIKGGFASADGVRSDFNIFNQLSFQSTPVYMTKELAQSGAAVSAPYAISEGPLVPITYEFDSDGNLVSNIACGISIGASTTVGEFTAEIIKNTGWQKNDMLSIVFLMQGGDADYPNVSASAEHLQLSENSSLLVKDLMPSVSVVNGKIALAGLDGGSAGFVHSRKSSNGRKCSTQFLASANDLLDNFTGDEALETAAESYGGISDDAYYYGGNEGDSPTPPSDKKTITVNVADYCMAMGKVQINDGPMDNTEKSLEVEPGTQVTIKAAPVSGYQFCNWSDGDSNATRTVTVNDDCEFTAEFEES